MSDPAVWASKTPKNRAVSLFNSIDRVNINFTVGIFERLAEYVINNYQISAYVFNKLEYRSFLTFYAEAKMIY